MDSRFQILLSGVLGVVRKYRGSTIFYFFYCIFMTKLFEVFWRGKWGAHLIPPAPPLPCTSMNQMFFQYSRFFWVNPNIFLETKYLGDLKGKTIVFENHSKFTVVIKDPELYLLNRFSVTFVYCLVSFSIKFVFINMKKVKLLQPSQF
jgi:hypothetical protein